MSLLPLAAAPELVDPECGNLATVDLNACVFAQPGATKDAVVLGDSMAVSWLPGLRQALEPRGYRIHVAAYSTCPVADVTIRLPDNPGTADTCNRTHTELAQGVRRLRPELVIGSDIELGIDNVATPSAGDASYALGLARQVALFRAAGSRVVLLAPPPSGAFPELCAQGRRPLNTCSRPRPATWLRKRAADERGAALGGARYVDTSPWFCSPAGPCPLVIGGTVVRWDGFHLTAQYSRRLAPELSAVLLPLP